MWSIIVARTRDVMVENVIFFNGIVYDLLGIPVDYQNHPLGRQKG